MQFDPKELKRHTKAELDSTFQNCDTHARTVELVTHNPTSLFNTVTTLDLGRKESHTLTVKCS